MSGTLFAGRGMRVFRALTRVWALVPVAVALGLLAHARLATADVMPPERRTTWNPGIPGGIPDCTTVCATVNAVRPTGTARWTPRPASRPPSTPARTGRSSSSRPGTSWSTGPIPITIDKGIVLRGAGPPATKLRKTSSIAEPAHPDRTSGGSRRPRPST